MRKVGYIFIGVVMLALVGLGVFNLVVKPQLIAKFMSGRQAPVVTVSAAPAELRDWQPTLSAVGTLKAVQGVTVTTEIGGTVEEIRFNSGDDVAAGDVLVRLNDDVEQAQLESNLAALKNAELALKRARELFARGNTSAANLDQAQANRDSAAADVARQRAVIDKKTIRAPFAGRLGIRQVNIGEYLPPGAAIVGLQSIDPIFANFQMPERNAADLAVGQRVRIKIDAHPQRTFEGRITSIDSAVSTASRMLLVQATLDNPEGLLVPGMFADVTVILPTVVDAVAVPETAVAYSLYGDTVYVVKPPPPGEEGIDGVVERRTVKVGQQADGWVRILDGVAAGELVATTGQHKLGDGSRVKLGENLLKPRSELPRG